jgi:hypothetical protein
MPRPRSNVLKIGDQIEYRPTNGEIKGGVVVDVIKNNKLLSKRFPSETQLYNVHFNPIGRGIFSFKQLHKVKATFALSEIIKDEVENEEEKV